MKQFKIAAIAFLALVAIAVVLLHFFWSVEPRMMDLPSSNDTYDQDWVRFDSMRTQGLPKSQYALLTQIATKADREGNGQQVLKCAFKAMELLPAIDEKAELSTLALLQYGAAKAKFPLRQVFHSALGQFYWNYSTTNIWRLADQTAVATNLNEDFRTWDLKRLTAMADRHYALSIANPDSLRRVSLDHIDAVLHHDFGGRPYRPTLIDLLAWRAMDFYQSAQAGITQPAAQFRMDDAKALAPAGDFAYASFGGLDSTSYQLKALKLYQTLLRQHIHDRDPRPRVLADLDRLKYVKNNALIEGRDSLYLAALLKLERQFEGDPVSAFVAAEIATVYMKSDFQTLDAGTGKPRDLRAMALRILDKALDLYQDSDGGDFCTNLRNQLLQKEFNLQMDAVHPIGEPALATLTYQNVGHVWLRIVRDPLSKKEFAPYQSPEDMIYRLSRMPAVKAWDLVLSHKLDIASHKLQLVIPGLPAGRYSLLVGTSEDMELGTEAAAYASFNVSNFGYVVRKPEQAGTEYIVVDRSTGQPLADIESRVFQQRYDYDQRINYWDLIATLRTQADGLLPTGTIKSSEQLQVEFIRGTDTLMTTGEYIDDFYLGEFPRKTTRRTTFFTDRAIYRPGQTIYFKGIVLESDGTNAKVLPGVSEEVTLLDANYQKVAKLQVRTNEFGSFSGTFTAPMGQLTGTMQLRDDHGAISVSVEDYKRPKFEVEFDPIKGSFQLGKAVKVKGKAIAYAGSNIADAEVNYRVQRSATFPWCGFWGWKSILPITPAMEITSGTVKTDASGAFEIEFQAIADQSLNQALRPKFNYEVTADVVDITGETQSAVTNASIGYQAIDLSLSMPTVVEQASFKGCKVLANNLNGEPEPTKGTIEIHALEMPDHVLQAQSGDSPDRYILSKKRFKELFPDQVQEQEADPETWKKAKKVFAGPFDTEKNDSLRIPDLRSWPQGTYLLEANCKDKFGTEVKYVQRFTLYAATSTQLPQLEPLWVAPLKAQYEPGDTVVMDVGTGYTEGGWLHYEVEHRGKIVTQEWLCISPERQQLKIPITEQHRGNLSVILFFAKNGRQYHQNHLINVPWTNKRLDIEFATFRDKLLPGEKQEWRVKIKGPEGEKAAAEVLAGMYDQSLDAFQTQSWGLYPFTTFGTTMAWLGEGGFARTYTQLVAGESFQPTGAAEGLGFDQLDLPYYSWSGWGIESGYYKLGGTFVTGGGYGNSLRFSDMSYVAMAPPAPMMDASGDDANNFAALEEVMVADSTSALSSVGNASYSFATTVNGATATQMDPSKSDKSGPPPPPQVHVRTNLNETAFFYPQLKTDAEGAVIFSFTMPEALTKWKFRAFSHTKDLKTGYKDAEVVTQKELMVQPNTPRFFRENDEIVYSAKVTNLSEKDQSGQAYLELFDAITMAPADAQLAHSTAAQPFSIKKGQSTVVKWTLKVPAGIQGITHRVKAVAGNFSDGEESSLPVLTNSMLVTEAMPMPLRPLQTKTFDFTRLRNNKSTTLRQHKLTLEFTSNPAWYAIQALPYMMEYPYECTEQTFSRFYANSIATHIANKHPRIKAVFDQWKSAGKEALLSNLEKNEELKYLLLEETPWVMNAQNESARKQHVGLLFDLSRMQDEQGRARKKILAAQTPNGGFTWFPGMPDSRYITQHLVCGFGHLDHLGIESVRKDGGIWSMVQRAVRYLDERIKEDYQWILDHTKTKAEMDLQHIGWDHVHFLYARSFFQDLPVSSGCATAVNYYIGQAKKYWLQFNNYNQGMIALALHRGGDKETPQSILRSLKEFSMHDEEMGMYWKSSGDGLYWYQAPIETQALLIEAFGEVTNDQAAVEEMKLWLLKQKQTQDWKTTIATAEACYALLLSGADYLAESKLADITIGGKKLNPAADLSLKVEAGTGYFKTSWMGEAITPEMGRVEVKNNNKVAAWGALYWQYFEQLDKITFAANKVQIQKQLFLQQNTPSGPQLSALNAGAKLKPGDLVKVRITIETDRDMEYVHLKDMRAAGFEPINVLSQYKYQGGLGYYETTRDAATNFFFDWLPKGKYVFEYPLRATHSGDFSNGITTIQCMYAPEFTSHSEGIRVKIR